MIKGPLAITDLETTGLSVTDDRVVSMSVVMINDDGTLGATREWLLNPGIPIPKGASDVHGITDKDVRNCPSFKDEAESIHEALSNAALGGYNVERYDLPLLAREFARIGMVPPWDHNTVVVDVFSLFRKLMPHSLAGAVRFYLGKEHESAHSATGDTLATVAVLQAMQERHHLPESPSQLAAVYSDRRVDRGGRLAKNHHGETCIAFGKHANKTLKELTNSAEGMSYLRWILRQEFGPDVDNAIVEAMTAARRSA